MQFLLNIVSRPSGADCKFQWPRLALLVDDTIYIDEAAIAFLLQRIGQGFEHLASQLGAGDIAQDGPLLSSSDAHVAIHELLKLEVLAPRRGPTVLPKPSANCHFDPRDKLLEYEWAFEFTDPLPPLQHIDEIGGTLGTIRKGFIRIPARLRNEAPVLLFNVGDRFVVVRKFFARWDLDTVRHKDFHTLMAVQFPAGHFGGRSDDGRCTELLVCVQFPKVARIIGVEDEISPIDPGRKVFDHINQTAFTDVLSLRRLPDEMFDLVAELRGAPREIESSAGRVDNQESHWVPLYGVAR